LAVPVFGVLAVEASLLVAARVHHVAVAVAVQTAAPPFAVAVAARHATWWQCYKHYFRRFLPIFASSQILAIFWRFSPIFDGLRLIFADFCLFLDEFRRFSPIFG
jgi:hypothetical protein